MNAAKSRKTTRTLWKKAIGEQWKEHNRCSATIRHSNPIRPIINDNGTEAGANYHAYGLYARLMRTGQKSTCGTKLP